MSELSDRLHSLLADCIDGEPEVVGDPPRFTFESLGVEMMLGTFATVSGEHVFVQAKMATGVRCSEEVLVGLSALQTGQMQLCRFSIDQAGTLWISAELHGPTLNRNELLKTLVEIRSSRTVRESVAAMSAEAPRRAPIGVPVPPEPRQPPPSATPPPPPNAGSPPPPPPPPPPPS